MYSFWLGIGAFVLYLIYDINSFAWKRKVPGSFFLAGTLCLAAATVWDLWEAWYAGAISGTVDVLLLTGALVWFAFLIYTLFFALPFKETYAEQSDKRRVYSGGVYALCRHPGILCFFGMYLLLGLVGLPVFSGFRGGAAALLDPAGGFLWGFLLAGLAYRLLERLGKLPAMTAALLVAYACGCLWFTFWAGVPWYTALLTCVVPYLIPDALKLWMAYTLSKRIGKYIR